MSPSESAQPDFNPYFPDHHDPDDFIPGNPHMLKIASHTAYRSAARSPSSILSKKPAWVNTSRSISLSPHGSSHTSPAGTPTRNRSPARGFAATSASTGKQDAAANAPPKHEMVHFPGLTSERRRFGDSRRVLHTGLYSQLAAMAIPPGGDTGAEAHAVDQTLLFTHGAGDVVVVPAGARHRFLNTGPEPLQLVAVCAPAEDGARTVNATEEEGEREEEEEEEEGGDGAPGWARRGRAESEKVGLVRVEGGPCEE
ncbi:hypothetical protein SLS56_011804 [Neofusicoccum ribis]|uniref:Cupin 2 conserved barrel domain-containing protein n=1 Tax=Neofusicoccum ribis TaxID=45134 RepID=A0ABR3SBL4_9PEZI